MKTILKSFFILLCTGLLTVSCTDNDSMSDAQAALVELIHSAENLIATTEEGVELGNIAPGSKDALQARIDQAYFIMDNTDREEAYTNAAELLQAAIDAFSSNIVKAGIPHFGLGSKMNLGPASQWGLEDAFTIEMRIRCTEFASGDQNVISCESSNGGCMIRNNDNQLQFYINNGGWAGGTVLTMELNRWYHIAATYEAGGDMNFYVDGDLVSTVANCGTMVASTTDLQAGTAPSYNDRYWRGDIQNVSIWEDVRTADEVAADVACDFAGTEDGLMAYWPLDLNAGTSITDETGNHVAELSDVTWIDVD